MRRRFVQAAVAVALAAWGSWPLAGQDEPGERPKKGAKPKQTAKPVDLLKLIDPARHTVRGKWAVQRKTLASSPKDVSCLQLPYEPPAEYDLEVVAQRVRGIEGLAIGLPTGDSQPSVILEGAEGRCSGLNRLDGRPFHDNETAYRRKVFADARPSVVRCAVRKDGITVTVDDKTVVDWRGDADRLSHDPHYAVPNKRALLLGAFRSEFHVTKLVLTPVSGQGKRLR